MLYDYQTPHNEVYCSIITCPDDMDKVETRVMQLLRLRNGRFEGFLTASYLTFRTTVLHEIKCKYGKDVYKCMTHVLPGGLRITLEVEHGECLISLRWTDCVFPNEYETKCLEKGKKLSGRKRNAVNDAM